MLLDLGFKTLKLAIFPKKKEDYARKIGKIGPGEKYTKVF